MSDVTYTQEDWEAPWESDAQPNQRLQLALPPFGVRPLAVAARRALTDGSRCDCCPCSYDPRVLVGRS
jgi:hypothetical protein